MAATVEQTKGLEESKASRDDAHILIDSEVNKKVRPKICKVMSPYGEGSGYIVDDINGIILSSFHLISTIKTLLITNNTKFNNIWLISILHTVGYIDDELRLTSKALAVSSEEEITRTIQSIKLRYQVVESIKIDPQEIEDMLRTPEIQAWLSNAIKKTQEILTTTQKPCEFKFDTREVTQKKMALALTVTGFLDQNFVTTDKFLSLRDLGSIIPKNLLFSTYTLQMKSVVTSKKERERIRKRLIELFTKNINNLRTDIFNFFKQGRINKDVVLLSKTVEIECGGEILIGEILTTSLKTEEENRVLKNFAYFDTVPIKVTRFKNGAAFGGGLRVIRTGAPIPVLPESEEEPDIGEKVYFGGYNLTQQTYIFNTGIISGITSSTGRTSFFIEAPIAPGNSGSPIFIQRNGQIYRIGVINSEIAHISEKMLEIQGMLDIHPELSPMGGLRLIESFRELTTTVLANLSTGQGKAFSAPNIEDLCNPNLFGQDAIMLDTFLDFLVPKKGPNKIREKAKAEIEARKCTVIFETYEYMGVTYYLDADKHGKKHTKLSQTIYNNLQRDPRYLRDRWGDKDATFNPDCSNDYLKILKEVIEIRARSSKKSNYVRYTKPVGWDKGRSKEGEETDIIELYYGDDGIGSHMRPKAASWLNADTIIELEASSAPTSSSPPARTSASSAGASLGDASKLSDGTAPLSGLGTGPAKGKTLIFKSPSAHTKLKDDAIMEASCPINFEEIQWLTGAKSPIEFSTSTELRNKLIRTIPGAKSIQSCPSKNTSTSSQFSHSSGASSSSSPMWELTFSTRIALEKFLALAASRDTTKLRN